MEAPMGCCLLTLVIFGAVIPVLNASYTPGNDYKIDNGKILIGEPISATGARTAVECIIVCNDNQCCHSANIMETNSSMYSCEMFDASITQHNKKKEDSVNGQCVEIIRKKPTPLPRLCDEVRKCSDVSGPVELMMDNGEKFDGFCDMDIVNGEGWLMVQRRIDDSVNFERDWANYKNGFGDIAGNFWLGLDKLHQLTKRGDLTLRFDMWDEEEHRYAEYKNVTVAGENDKYRLDFGEYEGDAGNSLSKSNNMKFSTMDQENDVYTLLDCAEHKNGGWWYGGCGPAHPNGVYLTNAVEVYSIHWGTFRNLHSLRRMEMKLR